MTGGLGLEYLLEVFENIWKNLKYIGLENGKNASRINLSFLFFGKKYKK